MNYDISKLPLLAGVGKHIIDPLQDGCSVSQFEAGQAIIHQGDKDTSVYFLLKGEAMKQRHREDGIAIGLGNVKQGEFFGEEFDGTEVSYTVMATMQCVVLNMPNAAFELAMSCSSVLARVCDKMAKSLRRGYDRIESSHHRSVQARIIHVLEENEGPMIIRNQSHFASMANTSREHLNRSLARMVKEGLLKRTPFPNHRFKLELSPQ